MFDTAGGAEAVADDPAVPVDTQLEDAFAWAAIERDLRQGGDDRTFGNTSPSGFLWNGEVFPPEDEDDPAPF